MEVLFYILVELYVLLLVAALLMGTLLAFGALAWQVAKALVDKFRNRK